MITDRNKSFFFTFHIHFIFFISFLHYSIQREKEINYKDKFITREKEKKYKLQRERQINNKEGKRGITKKKKEITKREKEKS